MGIPRETALATTESATLFDYWLDTWQRSILFWDVLRQRGNESLAHEKAGMPPVLEFEHELVLDARHFAEAANYALLRILPPPDVPSDPLRRPFVVIDPRAGHGPGIAGFKADSQIGLALRGGHPCYFVSFYPEPMPGQSIPSVAAAEARFLAEVEARHPQAEGRPFVIGNCQGGWALALLAASAPDKLGPILLAGAPVSYWAGVEGKNPMRYSGGLMGGSWLASLAGDLGNGRFDGAALVQNFEAMNPANTWVGKPYGLYSKVDTEAQRYLEFERWWGGHFLLNKAEIEWIVQKLFVGNHLVSGELRLSEQAEPVDLRNIHSPIIVFASWGDDITPPQQALGWITDTYERDEELLANEQVIVYCLHDKIGHLGIFVSGAVARRETSELVSALDLIDILPPGLYEAKIEDVAPDTANAKLIEGRYLIQFHPRSLADIRALDDGREDELAFEVVRRVAEINQGLYDQFLSPWLRKCSSEFTAATLRTFHPARLERNFWSDLNPMLWWLQALAKQVRATRRPLSAESPWRRVEAAWVEQLQSVLERSREAANQLQERSFKAIYENPALAASVGLDMAALARGRRNRRPHASLRAAYRDLKLAEVRASLRQGTELDGWVRALLYQGLEEQMIDERPYHLLRQLLAQVPPAQRPTLTEFKASVRRQFFVLRLFEDEALQTLPLLLPKQSAARLLQVMGQISAAKGYRSPAQQARLGRLAAVLGEAAPALPAGPQAAVADAEAPIAQPVRRSRRKQEGSESA